MDQVNEVHLVGKVSGEPVRRELPSGDEVTTFRLVVPRPERPGRPGTAAVGPRVDTIDIGCWTAGTRRSAARLSGGEQIEVLGSLRRRFFRSAGAPASRYEVEAVRLRKVG